MGLPASLVLRDETSLCVRLAEGEEVEEEGEGEEEEQLEKRADWERHDHIWTEREMKTK